MAKSYVLPAVTQAIVLSACGMIIQHHLLSHAGDYVQNSEVFQNWTNALTTIENATTAKNGYSGNFTVEANNGTIANYNFTMTANATSTTEDTSTEKSFYKSEFPTQLFLLLIITPLQYYWQIWLEKAFPGRLRAYEMPEQSVPEGFDVKEEAIVQKWIAQGKVKRASLSWWNTFVKWALDLTLGTLWVETIAAFYEDIAKDLTLKVLRKNISWMKWDILLRFVCSFVGIGPLASLVSFIVVPAHKRIVFMSAVDLVFTTFFGLFVKALLPWLEKTEFVKSLVTEITAQAEQKQQSAAAETLPQIRLIEEL